MKTSFYHRDLSPEEMSAWREAARRRALAARNEAIGDFLDAAVRSLHAAWRRRCGGLDGFRGPELGLNPGMLRESDLASRIVPLQGHDP